jgi:hypothetical protein
MTLPLENIYHKDFDVTNNLFDNESHLVLMVVLLHIYNLNNYSKLFKIIQNYLNYSNNRTEVQLTFSPK